MKKIDLDELRFTRAPVLACVPSMTAKDLGNWHDLGLLSEKVLIGITLHELDTGGRRRLYSATGIVVLAVMAALSSQGLTPGRVSKIAKYLAVLATWLHDKHPSEKDGSGRIRWPTDKWPPDRYRRAHFYRADADYWVLIEDGDKAFPLLSPEKKFSFAENRRKLPAACVTLELDYLTLDVFDRLYGVLAGVNQPTEQQQRTIEPMG